MKSANQTWSDKSPKCCICGVVDVSSDYPNMVCRECDSRALNKDTKKARHCGEYPDFIRGAKEHLNKTGALFLPPDDGDNPVFIDGIKCWRRYRFGGWVTMRDNYDCNSLEEFYEKHMRKR